MNITEQLETQQLIISNGQIYQTTPLTTIQNVIEELKTQITQDKLKEMTEHNLYKEIGRAVEYLTTNNYKINITRNDKKTIVSIFKPFKGNYINHERIGKEIIINQDNTRTEKRTKKKISIYIPDGWIGLTITIIDNKIERVSYLLIPQIEGQQPNTTLQDNTYNNFYHELHPHKLSDPAILCHGMTTRFPNQQFNISYAIELLTACLEGDAKKTGTSFFNYNKTSPAVTIDSCNYGHRATILKKENKTDQEIIQTITTERKAEEEAKRENPNTCHGCRNVIEEEEDCDCGRCGHTYCPNCYDNDFEECFECIDNHTTRCGDCDELHETDNINYCTACEGEYCNRCRKIINCPQCEEKYCEECAKTFKENKCEHCQKIEAKEIEVKE